MTLFEVRYKITDGEHEYTHTLLIKAKIDAEASKKTEECFADFLEVKRYEVCYC